MPGLELITADLLILRHGSTAANQLHQYCGRSDLPLSEAGRLQAAATRGWLLDRITKTWQPDRPVYCSPLLRCRETAAIIWPQCTPELDAAFVEADFGSWEGKTWADLHEDPAYRAWIEAGAQSDLAPPGGESRRMVYARVYAGFQRLLARRAHQSFALVTHGGVIMSLLTALTGRDDSFYDWQCQPAGGFLIRAGHSILPVPGDDGLSDDGLSGLAQLANRLD